MNELFQRRIESVQAGKNITYANIAAKRIQHEQYETDMDEFLANGGEIQVIPVGFSNFKNGILPKTAVKPVLSEQDRIDREKAIEAKNQEIRDYKAARKEQRRLEAKQKHDAQIKEQIAVMGRFTSKFPSKEDFKRLAEMTGYQTRHLRDAAKGHTKLGCEKWDLVKKVISNFKFGANA